MKTILEEYLNEVHISTAELERANLTEWERLELHLLDQTAVVIPGQMTVMELLRTVEALQSLASDLLAALCAACEQCNNCEMDEPCDQMKGEVYSEVSVPGHLLEELGLEPDTKLAYEADPESGAIHIVEADYRFDLTDIPAPLLDTLRECGVCMSDLEDKLVQEDVVYGTTETENS